MSPLLRIIAVPLILSMMACSLHRVADEVPVPESVPESFTTTGEVSVPERWWTAFDDATLTALNEAVLRANPDVAAARARLRQFRALAVQTGAARLPEVNGSAGVSKRNTLFGGRELTIEDYNLGVSVGYEVDVWQRIDNAAKASTLDAAAAREDLEALALSLTGAASRTYYAIAAQRELLAVLAEQVAVNEKLLAVIEARFANGVAGAVEVFQQRENLAAVEAQIPRAERTLAELSHLLATLVGEAPATAVPGTREELPVLPALPRTGVPTELLSNRPDIRAAALRVRAADHRVGVAIADQYPSFRLSGDGGFQATEIGDLFSNWVWSLAGNLAGPIFDAGRRRAEVTRTDAVLAERLASYEQVVLDALREVEDALAGERNQSELIRRLERQLELARQAERAAETRYLRGVGDYLTVLATVNAVQRVEQELVGARSTAVSDRIDLYLALGSSWRDDLEIAGSVEPDRDETDKGMQGDGK